MKLLFKQRFFSWLDSYDIFQEDGSVAYTVEGQLSWGHKLVIADTQGRELGMVKEEVFTFLPRFLLYLEGREVGCIQKKLTLFKPVFELDCLGWRIEGDLLEWDYTITDASGVEVAVISKEIFRFTDTYVLDIREARDAVYVLMIALAIDAAKCSSGG
ncbi:MAG: hypothetical protein HFG26_12140 [Provencibacterium sp.]|jgi:uncharacterized protein YxjI|nr:hypothetical protein [Provencibacterium sp.]